MDPYDTLERKIDVLQNNLWCDVYCTVLLYEKKNHQNKTTPPHSSEHQIGPEWQLDNKRTAIRDIWSKAMVKDYSNTASRGFDHIHVCRLTNSAPAKK